MSCAIAEAAEETIYRQQDTVNFNWSLDRRPLWIFLEELLRREITERLHEPVLFEVLHVAHLLPKTQSVISGSSIAYPMIIPDLCLLDCRTLSSFDMDDELAKIASTSCSTFQTVRRISASWAAHSYRLAEGITRCSKSLRTPPPLYLIPVALKIDSDVGL